MGEEEAADSERVLRRFRCVLATIAFGLGVDISDVDEVIHYGPSHSVWSFWQEMGRAGRDGRFASSTVYCVRSHLKNCDDDMKTLMNGVLSGSVLCMRRHILNSLLVEGMTMDIPAHNDCKLKCDLCECSRCRCCSLCKRACPCHKET